VQDAPERAGLARAGCPPSLGASLRRDRAREALSGSDALGEQSAPPLSLRVPPLSLAEARAKSESARLASAPQPGEDWRPPGLGLKSRPPLPSRHSFRLDSPAITARIYIHGSMKMCERFRNGKQGL
jgi:hypothetical protein